MSGGAPAGFVRGHARTNCRRSGGESGHRAPASGRLPQAGLRRLQPRPQLGWTPPIPPHARGGSGLLETVAQKRRRRPPGGRFADSGGAGTTTGPTGQALGGLSPAGPAWLAEGGPRHAPSQKQTRGASGLEKKLPEALATLLTPEAVKGRQVRLMFQDEARFGRMVRIRRCWAPAPQRPVVDNGYEREFQYVYGAVSPVAGELDWMICPAMNTEWMSAFLAQVSAAHPAGFIVMVVDGASSHVAKALVVPENIRLHRLPAYAPELNPQEHVWDEIREKEFPNRVFSDMAGVVQTLQTGLPRLASDHDRVRSICAWPWIVNLNLNAN
jgi:hypothetical protein